MGVLGEDDRPRQLGGVVLHGGRAGIVRGVDVDVVRQLGITLGKVGADLREAHGAGRVEFLGPAGGGDRERGVGVLVADAPDDHAGVVLVALHGGPGAREQGVAVVLVGQVFLAEAERHLVHHVETELVAKLEEARVGRVVGGADEIDVGGAHQLEVVAHEFLRGDATLPGPDVVVVDAVELDRPAIELEHAVRDGDLAQADPLREALAGRERQFERVEHRLLGGPELRVVDGQRGGSGDTFGGGERQPADRVAIRGDQPAADEAGPAGQRGHVQGGGAVGVELGPRRAVHEVDGRDGEQGHLAVDARERPAVVDIKLPAMAARGHAHGEHVLGVRLQLVRDVEGGGVVSAGPGADGDAVHPRVVAVKHAVETQHHAPARPPGGHAESAPVKPGALHELLAVFRFGEPLQLPVAGHGDLRPRRRPGEGRVAERPVGPELGAGDVFERPRPVERLGRGIPAHGGDIARLGERGGDGQDQKSGEAGGDERGHDTQSKPGH